jgi:N-acetylglucosamine kinase
LALDEPYVLGVDGGATKTVALFGNESGKVLGKGEAGPSNFHNIGANAAAKAIKDAAREAQRHAHLVGKRPEVAVVALAGIESGKDRAIAQRLVRKAKIARAALVVHDSVAALQAATQGKPGVVVISGTGTVAAGINSAGKYVRVGGWGYIIDDVGSGYFIGKEGLRMAFRAHDGRSPPTTLTRHLLERFSVRTLNEVATEIYVKGLTVDEVAQLARVVSRMAAHDRVCRGILNEAGLALGESVCAVARRLGMNRVPITVATIGSVFKAGRYVTAPFARRIKKEFPLAHIVRPKVEPAIGSFLLAHQELERRMSGRNWRTQFLST